MPLAVKTQDRITGFRILFGEKPDRSERASAKSFLARYPNSKVIFFSRHTKTPRLLDERTLLSPLNSLFF